MGKGSRQRPAQISQAELKKRWDQTFKRVEDSKDKRQLDMLESYKNRPGSAAKFTFGEWIELHARPDPRSNPNASY